MLGQFSVKLRKKFQYIDQLKKAYRHANDPAVPIDGKKEKIFLFLLKPLIAFGFLEKIRNGFVSSYNFYVRVKHWLDFVSRVEKPCLGFKGLVLKLKRFKFSPRGRVEKIDRLIVLVRKGNFRKALRYCKRQLRASPDDNFFLVQQACLVRRIYGWRESLICWEQYWHKNTIGKMVSVSSKESIFKKVSLAEEFVELSVDKAKSATSRYKKVCIYTSLFGDYDTLSPVYFSDENIDFVCFTDQDLTVAGWKIVQCEAKFSSSNLCAKEYKLFPHVFLKQYEASLYLDASTVIHHDITPLVNRFLSNERFVMFRHPVRNDVYDEGEAILQGLKNSPLKVIRQLELYEAEGMPVGAGLLEASFIWRAHDCQELADFMRLWWEEINRHSYRDQLSLSYVMWKTKLRPKILPEEFGNSRINAYFMKLHHKQMEKPSIKLPENLSLCFLYHNKHKNVGSTIMRGAQLVDLINASSEELHAKFDNDLRVKNKGLILTKGLLKEISVDEISSLKKNNYFVAADYLDYMPRPELQDYIDIYIASSIRGYYELSRKYEDRWVFLITHHVDPRLKKKGIPTDKLRPGYFGELQNTLHHQELAHLIDFHAVDTKNGGSDWMNDINNYNLHYAVRNSRDKEGEKPFLKGFIAAHCGANILIPRTEGDAMYYLPPDYPFFLDGTSKDEIESAVAKISHNFANDDWLYGVELMNKIKSRCSDEYVVNEALYLINQLRAQASGDR